MLNCNCNIDFDPDQFPECFTEVMIKARKEHKCCECGDIIMPGQIYRREKGIWNGKWDCFDTCSVCSAIRDDYCSCGFIYGELSKSIWECEGMDYITGETDDAFSSDQLTSVE